MHSQGTGLGCRAFQPRLRGARGQLSDCGAALGPMIRALRCEEPVSPSGPSLSGSHRPA